MTLTHEELDSLQERLQRLELLAAHSARAAAEAERRTEALARKLALLERKLANPRDTSL